ncbi:MAG: glucosyltransferase domain-containing protein [Lachnospiraceae bacterium]|nr:glucosyltransferase domain-containing protein [Lachnospiraceae bacterium]
MSTFDFFKLLQGKIPRRTKICFLTGIVIGFITHFYMMSNKLPNWDDLNNIKGAGVGKEFGRWAVGLWHHFFSTWSAPSINGMVAIVLFSVNACLVLEILRLKSETAAVLIPVITLTFPTIASDMTFMFMAADYAVAVLFAVIGVFFTLKFRFGFIVGIYFMYYSLGQYQAFLPMAAALYLLALIRDVYEMRETKSAAAGKVGSKAEAKAGAVGRHGWKVREKSPAEIAAYVLSPTPRPQSLKDIFVQGVKTLLMMGAGVGFYLMKSRQTELLGYRGINNMGHIDPARVPVTILRAYHRILQYYVTSPPAFITEHARDWHLYVLALTALLTVLILVQKKIFREPVRLIMLGAFYFLLPLAAAAVYMMAPDVDHASTMMIYPYMTILYLPVMLTELVEVRNGSLRIPGFIGNGSAAKAAAVGSAANADENGAANADGNDGARAASEHSDSLAAFLKTLIPATAIICTVISVSFAAYYNYRICNEAYFRTDIAFRRVGAFYERLVTRLENTEGYTYDQPVIIAGDYWPERNILSTYYMMGERYENFEGVALENGLFTSSVRNAFLRIYLGIDTPDVAEEEWRAVMATDEFKAMPKFPADGCVKKLGDAWVLKIAD